MMIRRIKKAKQMAQKNKVPQPTNEKTSSVNFPVCVFTIITILIYRKKNINMSLDIYMLQKGPGILMGNF